MKKLLAALILMPTMTNAGFCDAVYDFAEATMKMRQEGYQKYQAKEVVEDTRKYNEDLANLLDANVDWAYSFPIYNDSRRDSIANDFANTSYDVCKAEENKAKGVY